MNWEGTTFRDWFKAQESSLHQQAKLAGLLDHSTSVGTAREFLVKRVLQAVLPPLIHIGSGLVIDAHGNKSRQTDVVLYDSRFPLMEFESGVGLYPIEGVVATIEVKSDLDSDALKMALENCFSVLDLRLGGPNANAVRDRANGLQVELKCSPEEALLHAGCEVVPATYIFSFSGLSPKTLCATTCDWFESKQSPVLEFGPDENEGPAGLCPGLPRTIVSGNSVGIANDGWFRIEPCPEDYAAIQAEYGKFSRAMMAFWETDFPYWWFASHVLRTACSRLGMKHAASGMRYKIDHYIAHPADMSGLHYLPGTLRKRPSSALGDDQSPDAQRE